ncbi:MAG: T9SS type A sorting domain-containing protein [Bacteriodetes bacterium]|nr:T9SS type A sorting domain-containing protein [Bacteroidota bacterium]
MKLKFVLYCTILLCTVSSVTRAGIWDTLYTRQTNMDVGGVTFAPDDSFVIVTGLETNSNNSISKMYRPSDGQLLDERPFYFKQFTQDGKYALIWLGDNNIPKLVDWRNNWQVITTFEWDSLSNTYTISADNQTLVGFNAKGYTLWDAQTGKQRKQSQIFRDTVLSGSGQNSTDKITSLQGSALLGDSRTLCIVVNQYVFSGSLNKELSNKYYGISIDIETGELKAGADNIRAFFTIPGSTDVIVAGKTDETKIDFNTYYLYEGLHLTKKFQYQVPFDSYYLSNIRFNMNPTYFIYRTYQSTGIVDVQTGTFLQWVNGGIGFPFTLSNDNRYVAVSGLAMYDYNKLFNITNVESINNVQTNTYPQPTSGILTITNKDIQNDSPVLLKIYDLKGNQTNVTIPIISQLDGELRADVSALQNGKYNLTVQQSDKVFSYSFILIK